jgi:hypothetical protein
MSSSLLALVDAIEFQITEAYSTLDLANVKYSTYKQSREETLKVMERIRPTRFVHSENMKSTYLRKCYFVSKKTLRSYGTIVTTTTTTIIIIIIIN